MKTAKALLLLTVSALMLFSSACAGTPDSESSQGDISEESSVGEVSDDRLMSDTVKPTLRSMTQIIRINQGEEYDLMRGVSGYDNLEGSITNRVKIDKGGYDPDIPGEYMITYTLSDTAGNEAAPVTRTVIVRDSTVLEAPEIYTGVIAGEAPCPAAPAIFGGAWYHKAVSAKDKWTGIEGTVTLPEVKIRRYSGDYDSSLDIDPAAVNLDNPSVYLGGHAISESDVGLSFSRALTDVKSQTLSKGSIAFRPFWRYITSTDQDVGEYGAHDGEYAVTANGNNCIANYHWRYTEFYYLPGDTLRMIIYIPEAGKMQLQIEVIAKSTLPESVATREKYGWKDPANFKSPVFAAPGHGTGMSCEYKRVNAIDQSGNEGGTAIVSDTEISNAVWSDTYLYRIIDGVMRRIPMTDARRGVTDAPDKTKFTVTCPDPSSGGEIITIHPGYSE